MANLNVLPGSTPLRGTIVDTVACAPYVWMARIGFGHASVATLGGQVEPFTGDVGHYPIGRNNGPSGVLPDYTPAAKDGTVTGNTSLKPPVSIECLRDERLVVGATVAGVTGLVDINKQVYLTALNELTITKGTANTILGTPVGYIVEVLDAATDSCNVVEFSEAQIMQNAKIEAVPQVP